MGRLILLELKKLAKPVIAVLVILTVLTCVLSCTLFRSYSLQYALDKWEIGTEYIGLLFPLFVTIPVCQCRFDFVVFRRKGNVEKWRVNVYSL